MDREYELDEYKEVNREMEGIIETRMEKTNQHQEWNYNREVGKALMQQPFKYQHVEMAPHIDLTEDIRQMIYDEKAYPDDLKIFTSTDWQLAPISDKVVHPPQNIPSRQYLQSKKIDQKEIDTFYGAVEMQGNLKGKSNQINYNNYFYNLRSNALVIYQNRNMDSMSKQLFYIILNEKTYDYLSDNPDYVLLRGDQKHLKIQREQNSKQLLAKIQKKLLLYSFRGAYALRNQVPSWRVEDYIQGEIDTLGTIDFHDESKIKQITRVKYYKETIGAFLKLLEKSSKKRRNISGEMNYPRWLKQEFRDIPCFQTFLSTNVIPPQHALMTLKIKVNQNQKQGLIYSLKYVFPYIQNYVKRHFVLYQSELKDNELIRVIQNISYPMFSIGFPYNDLSITSLNYAIQKSSDLYHEVLDFSHNTKLTAIGGSKTMNLINNNPSIKKLYLRGCQVSADDQETFFDALSSNLCISELELDYSDNYNEDMVVFLDEFDAAIE